MQELLTIKSDDIDGRNDMYESILVRKEIEKPNPSIPESFLALIRELQSLGLDFSIKKFESGIESPNKMRESEKDIFKEIELRLKLRALLARKKAEQFAKVNTFVSEDGDNRLEKISEKNRILERLKNAESKI